MEIKRVFGNRKVIFLIVTLVLVNLGWFYYNEKSGSINTYYSLEYRTSVLDEVRAKTNKMTETERYEWLVNDYNNSMDTFERVCEDEKQRSLAREKFYRANVIKDLVESSEHRRSYRSYILDISSDVDSLKEISIFNKKGSYANKNLTKSAKDYQGLEALVLEPGADEAVIQVLDFALPHLLSLIFAGILVTMFTGEQQRSVHKLLYATPRGRVEYAVKQGGIIFGGSFLFSFFIILSTFIESFCIYGGWSDLERPIQSILRFREYTWAISEGSYILFYLVICSVITSGLAIFMWFILTIARNQTLGYLEIIIIFGIEWTLYRLVLPQSIICITKYVNLFFFINPTEALSTYRNINIGLGLLELQKVVVISTILILILLLVAAVWVKAKRKPIQIAGRVEKWIERRIHFIQKKIYKGLSTISFHSMEIFRFLFLKRIWVVWVICILYVMSILQVHEVHYSKAGYLMRDYYEEFHGEYSNEKIQELQNKLDGGNDSDLMEGYDSLITQMNTLQEIEKRTGHKQKLICQTPYEYMYGEKSVERLEKLAFVAIILLISSICAIFSKQKSNNMDRLIRTTVNGRQRYQNVRMIDTILISFVIETALYWGDFFYIKQTYGLTDLSAPIQSVLQFMDVPVKCTIMGVIMLMYIIHVLLFISYAMIIAWIASKVELIISMIVSTIGFVSFSILESLGLDMKAFFTPVSLLGFTRCFQEGGRVDLYCKAIIAIIILGIIMGIVVKKSWSKVEVVK